MKSKKQHIGSRFNQYTRYPAIFIIVVIGILMAAGMEFDAKQTAATSESVNTNTDPNQDLTLYRTVINQLKMGQPYYSTTAKLLREGNYPLRPFIVFRLPTLALISAALGTHAMYALLWATMLITVLVWWVRLEHAFHLPARRVSGVGLIVAGLLVTGRPNLIVFHEVWAGLLIIVSLGLYQPGRWLPSVMLGLCAVLIRETALPFVLLMAAHAAWQRRGREFSGWIIVVVLFCSGLVCHAIQVNGVTMGTDPASPGWNNFGGWPFFVWTMRKSTFLRAFPQWISAVVVPLSLLGWASWRSTTGLLGFFLLAGFALILMVFGRPDTFYWGLIVAPLFPLGIAFMPLAVRDLRAAIVNHN